ncbi:Modification methylase HphIA [Colletotrichum chlorophyti]|uniref:DNA (cytosine-5-)-methyltransferase n=1 Tax=Colletotrichum chlorophyti TaxID=708187 RepID=A0A1Q8S520_9PEZI|nr:Modification methylase HphIA [Colletotrichum chlorophyti]
MNFSNGRNGTDPNRPINLETYDEPVRTRFDQEVAEIQWRILNYRTQAPNAIRAESNDVDEEEEDNAATRELDDVIDLTVDDEPVFLHSRRRSRPQPQPILLEVRHQRVPGARDFSIKVNFLYELDPEEPYVTRSGLEVHFIFVTAITEILETHEIRVKGLPYSRSRTLMAKLPRKLNEVFAIYELEEDDDQPPEQQAMVTVSPRALIKYRTLHLTNESYPRHRYDPRVFTRTSTVEKDGPLVCRWKYFIHYQDAQKKKAGKAHHWSLERVRADEVKRPDFRISEDTLRTEWRGEVNRGGSHIPEARELAAGDKQRYTVFDSFCGAGGFSRGAERAGLHVKYAIDHWDRACDTHRLNFPRTQLFQMSVDQFMQEHRDSNMDTDILHLSPPCQTWSPAHTIAGANDEANIAALFACRSLVEKMRPRIFTLEQTFGIMKPCHAPFFSSLIGGFTEFGYSVTWKIVHLQTWGLPQVRKRLILIGACPGEKLPPFPTATHSEIGVGGMRKFVTIRQALSKINNNSTFHDPEAEKKNTLPSGSVVSDPDQILRRCITCSGGQNMHWDNTRAYTIREFASLQGFPVWHQFAEAPKSALKKQIGNAFPACVVRHLCEHLKNWLLEVDGLTAPGHLRNSIGGRELVFVSEGGRSATAALARPNIFPSVERVVDNSVMIHEDDQIDIQFKEDPDEEMIDYIRSRSVTMSLGGTPEPYQSGGSEDSPMIID